MPLVSIYIPTRDRLAMLQRAVASCLAQTVSDFELIIVDDASPAPVQAEITALASQDPRIRLFLQPSQQGACAARNVAIAAAQGEFITGLDDDDEFLPQRLETFLTAWQSEPQYAFLCAASYLQLRQGKRVKAFSGQRQVSLADLLSANLVGNQVFTRTEYLRAVGGFDEQQPSCQDYDTWVRLTERFGPALRLAAVTQIVHQEHQAGRISASPQRLAGYQRFFAKHQHLMTPAQRRHQQFLQQLCNENVSVWALLKAAPLPMLPVTLKVCALRLLGYAL